MRSRVPRPCQRRPKQRAFRERPAATPRFPACSCPANTEGQGSSPCLGRFRAQSRERITRNYVHLFGLPMPAELIVAF